MITQIILNNTASYKSIAQLNTDKKVNIIYGLNGSGKSTFSNYFYNPTNTDYQSCSHIGEYDSILVYNQKFIQDNFYDKDNLNGIFSLSKENKAAQQKVEEISLELNKIAKVREQHKFEIINQNRIINEAKERAQAKVWEIKTNYTGGDRVLEFCLRGRMGSKESLFNYLCTIPLLPTKPTNTIENIKTLANAIEGEAAIKHSLLRTINYLNLADEDVSSLSEIIVGSNDSPVSNLIVKLQNSDWVSEGLKYIDDSQCPFCQAQTITQELVSQINNYFDESYKKSLEEIKTILARYSSIVSNIPNFETYNQNPFASEFLIQLNEVYVQLHKKIEENFEIIKQKILNPSLQITLQNTNSLVDSFNSFINAINTTINEHNSRIDNAETEKAKLKSEFWSILRFEYDQTISNFNVVKNLAEKHISEISQADSAYEQIESDKDNERIAYQKSTVHIEDAIININQGLIDIGITDFYIKKHEEELYRIVRTGSDDKIFSSLSEGEKMIISFLYFRELLKGRSTSTEGQLKKIAIIDDPVSSLSHIFVYNIGRLLRNDFFNSPHIAQIFVLTHSLYFFYELTETNKDLRHERQNLFRLSKNSDGSSIKAMKYEEIQNDYQSYWSVINDDKQPPALIANCMRNIIEYFFNFVQKADLSNVIQKPELKNLRFQSFLRYINRESHSLGQNIFDFKEFNYADFKEGLRLIFAETGYSEHYKKMARIST
ncbi:AAA family ATPase [Acinetobacter johnsonii]|uniref:AAA family ATPase n=1 Tax=Acinetobacter johnsonii TaxID=40214 RepID=A0AA42IEF0_ACIJO|nr:AAA family ATPase [Acinetobacter johnsonii]MDH0655958.1 AAA family ATPase [Acinetobacter johnsonii]